MQSILPNLLAIEKSNAVPSALVVVPPHKPTNVRHFVPRVEFNHLHIWF